MRCQACDREAGEGNYCDSHKIAYETVTMKYERWREALGLSWKEYLSEIAKNSLTGEWSREIAEHLRKTEKK